MPVLIAAADGSPYFALVTHSVSYAWHASFLQLELATLEVYTAAAEGDSKGGAFFLNLFTMN
jgi:hypothetical protein